MKPEPEKMNVGERTIFLVTEVSNIKDDLGEIKELIKDQKEDCDKKYMTSGKTYGAIFKVLGFMGVVLGAVAAFFKPIISVLAALIP